MSREQVVWEMRQLAEAGEGPAAWQLYDWAERLQEQGEAPVVTDAMVERAVDAYNYDQVAQMQGHGRMDRNRAIRAALTAALVQP